MKLLSIIIPCYNSQDYMAKAIDSLLGSINDIEVIIVNDGSSDSTLDIARMYEKNYPGSIIVIDQENAGHGGAVNTGLNIATGLYVRVLDSDDSMIPSSLKKLISTIEDFKENNHYSDVIITNFVYDKLGKKKKKVMSYKNVFEENEIHTWDNIGNLRIGQYILMHSVTFKTSVIKDRAKLCLPKHMFYVDNLYIFETLHHVRSLYYININLYKYFIGRQDQSVNEDVMMRRIEQQIKITKLMIEKYNPSKIINSNQEKVLISYLTTIILVTSILLNKIGTPEALEKKKAIWKYLRDNNIYVYRKARKSLFGVVCNANSKLSIEVTKLLYKISQKIYGFN